MAFPKINCGVSNNNDLKVTYIIKRACLEECRLCIFNIVRQHLLNKVNKTL